MVLAALELFLRKNEDIFPAPNSLDDAASVGLETFSLLEEFIKQPPPLSDNEPLLEFDLDVGLE